MSTEINVSANSNDAPSVVEVFVDKDAAASVEAAIIRAEQVLNQTINLISGIDNRNTILFDAGFTKIGQQFTALANTRWNIGGAEYFNAEQIPLYIELSSAGKQRWVRVCLNRDNNFFLLQGEELVENPPLPVLLDNTLSYTFFLVTDTNVGNATPPVTGEIYKPKNESNFVKAVGNNPNDYIESFWLNTEASHIVLESIAEIKSLVLREGFKAYPGKQVFITNNGVSDLKIKHGHLSNVKFVFANNTDYIAKPKETVVFYLSEDLTQAHFLSSSISSNKGADSEIQLIDSNISVTAFADGQPYYYKMQSGITLNFSTTISGNITNANDLVANFADFPTIIVPNKCKLASVKMILSNTTEFELAILTKSSIIPGQGVKILKKKLVSAFLLGFAVVDVNLSSENITLEKGDALIIYSRATAPVGAAKNGNILITVNNL